MNSEVSTVNQVNPKMKRPITSKVVDFFQKYWLSYAFIAPFFITFLLFIVIPTVAAVGLSFTYFNAIEPPSFVGWSNYQTLLTQDLIFWQHALPNTFLFSIAVGPLGYILAFVLAWLISQLPNTIRLFYTLAIYSPSMTAGVAMAVVWLIVFSGDRLGYLNAMLLELGILDKPEVWVLDPKYLMTVMILITLWGSMGVGFLALLAGILGIDKQLYEAGKVDGIRNRLQEIWYITIPSMKPQMLFGAVMAIVGTLRAGEISEQLTGLNPSPEYSGHLLLNHIGDHGFIRYEMGYASAITVVLMIFIYIITKFCFKLFGSKGV